MPVHYCPHCSIPCLDAEFTQGICPACKAPLAPPRDVPALPPAASPGPRRALPFLLGFLAGGLIGPAALWTAFPGGVSLPGTEREPTEASQAQQTQAENRARESEDAHQGAKLQHVEALKALSLAKAQVATVEGRKEAAEQRLQETLARVEAEQKRRISLEKVLAEAKKPRPTQSFVRDWQLVGPFPSTDNNAHDTVFAPEREPIQLQKAYDGFGGRVQWRPYHGKEDKIDVGRFYEYFGAGAAYAVSWVYSDREQPVTLSIGSDDGVCVWVNRAKVDDVKGGRMASPGQDIVKAHLKEGWNEVLAKVDNIHGDWLLYVEFRTADGNQPLPVFSSNSPPPAPRQ